MSRRVELYIFAALLVVLGYVLYHTMRPAGGGGSVTGVVAADGRFRPLDIQEPELHLDLLDNLRESQYSGTHRDIFSAEPLPPPKAQLRAQKAMGPVGPPPTPPLQVPVQFFGYASTRDSGRRVGFFSSGDDVLVLAQGDTFLDRYRLVSITDASADVMEISTGRHETLPITQPPGGSAN
jgi:hypothetical protein